MYLAQIKRGVTKVLIAECMEVPIAIKHNTNSQGTINVAIV